jgi:tetratricopeptide (TPR) repeat protein
MRTLVAVLVASQFALVSPALAGNEIRKARERNAKGLAREARELEKRGRLADARAKYLAAEGVHPTKDAQKGLARVAKETNEEVATLLDRAHASFAGDDFRAALAALDEARKLDPGNAAVAYDMALCHLRLGDRPAALELLEFSAARAPDERLAADVAALAALVRTGRAPAVLGAPEAAKVAEVEARAGKRDTAGACALLRDVYQALRDNAPAAYNLASCEEEAGRLREAVELYRRYLKLAPAALNAPDVEERIANLTSYAANVADDPSIRELHLRAFQQIQANRLRDGIGALEAATARAPGHAETWWLLATVYQAIGDTVGAARALHTYGALVDENRRGRARERAGALSSQRARYHERVGVARARVAGLLRRYFWDVLSFEYAQDELAKAQVDLAAALEDFPFGGDAHCLLSLIAQQGGGTAGEQSNAVLAGLGVPVRFYAAARPNGAKRVSVARIGLAPGTITIRPIADHDLDSSLCLTEGVDSPDDPLDGVSRVETDGNRLAIAASGYERLDLFPAVLTSPYPPNGPAGRRLVNRYTRLFKSAAGYERISLGNERMTGFEKFRLGLEFAASAAGGFLNAPSSASSLVKVLNAAYSGFSTLAASVRSMYGLWGPPPFIPMPARMPRLAFRSPDFSEMASSTTMADAGSSLFLPAAPVSASLQTGPERLLDEQLKTPAAALEPPPAPRAPAVEQPVSAGVPPATRGVLKLHVVPWANVEINGREYGQTPFEPVSLPAGEYSVRFLHPVYHPITREVTIVAGVTARVDVDFTWEGFQK